MREGPEVDAGRRTTDRSATGWGFLVLVASALAMVAAVSGLVEWWDYLPQAARPTSCRPSDFCAGTFGGARAGVGQDSVLLITAVLAVALVLWATVRAVRSRSARAAGAAVAALGAAVAAVIAGIAAASLRWDQVGLWAMESGRSISSLRGFGWLFDDRAHRVRFALVGGAETGIDTMRRWAFAHVTAGLLAFALLALALWLLRPQPAAPRRTREDPLSE